MRLPKANMYHGLRDIWGYLFPALVIVPPERKRGLPASLVFKLTQARVWPLTSRSGLSIVSFRLQGTLPGDENPLIPSSARHFPN